MTEENVRCKPAPLPDGLLEMPVEGLNLVEGPLGAQWSRSEAVVLVFLRHLG